jgi:transglutaminase-like putative cysteine protease
MLTKPRPWDYLSIILILICTWLPAAMLRSTGWSKGLFLVEILALSSAVIGLGLGRTKLSSPQVNAFFLFLTVIIPPGVFMFYMTSTGNLAERFNMFAIRINLAVTQMFVGRVIQDSILFTIFCGFFFWIIGYFTGYGYSRRGNPWQGLLTAAVNFGVIVFYSGSTRQAEWTGAVLVFCLLLLAARLHWEEKRSEWNQNRYSVEKHAGRSVFAVATVISLFLVFIGWNLQRIILSFTPGTPEQEQLSAFMEDIQAGVQTNIPALQSATSLTGSYPGGLKLGTQAPLQQTPAFQVKVITSTIPETRYYWRARVYDQYIKGQWRAPDITNLNGAFLQPAEVNGQSVFSQVKIQYIWQKGDGTIIPYAGRASRVDIPTRFEIFTGNGATTGDGILFPQQPLSQNSLLIVDSAVFAGSGADLRVINSGMPPDIPLTNLQIPSTVPQRVIDLGRQLAVGQTVYDRVAAVTQYLRKEYEYKSQISPIPPGKDPVDWFLFESKQGFCNYFASAEVILLRAAGIPARLAVGYSQGERTNDGFEIRLNNGHAWPEVYFAGIGWVPFEPTASEPDTPYMSGDEPGQETKQPEIQQTKPNPQPPVANQPQADESGKIADDRRTTNRWTLLTLLLIAALICGAGIWLGFKKNFWKKPPRISRLILKWLSALHWRIPNWLARWDWYNNLPEPGQQYVRLAKLAGLFRMSPDVPVTPYELLDTLEVYMPDSGRDISTFKAGLYNALYSSDPGYIDDKCRAAGTALLQAIWNAFWKNLF